jgi:hypothetical protein
VAFPFDLVRIHLSFIAVTLAFDHLDTAAADIKLRSRPYPDCCVPADPRQEDACRSGRLQEKSGLSSS